MLLRLVSLQLLAGCVLLCSPAALFAISFELRGTGKLPSFGTPPAGVVGEDIVVSVMLNSDDFDYEVVANPVFHYFVPNKTVPVQITGSVSGAYSNISPISRFLALELTAEANSDDQFALGVAFGNTSTTLLSVYADDGDGFDGSVTPFNSTELFTLFAAAMQNQAEWSRSTNSSVFIGSESLYLGNLQWSLVDPGMPPTQQLSILPSFDVQLKPGNAYPLGNATSPTLEIDGGFGASFPVLDVLLDFPLSGIPAGATITSAKLKLDAISSSGTVTVQTLGYAGDGIASLADESAIKTLIGSKAGTVSSTQDVEMPLNVDYINSLLGDATHLGLRLKSGSAGPYIQIAASEHATGKAPTLVLEYSVGMSGDFDESGVVDGSDFLVWQRGGSPAPHSTVDLNAWKANFGQSSAAPSASTAVPEPTAWHLVGAMFAIGCVAKRFSASELGFFQRRRCQWLR